MGHVRNNQVIEQFDSKDLSSVFQSLRYLVVRVARGEDFWNDSRGQRSIASSFGTMSIFVNGG